MINDKDENVMFPNLFKKMEEIAKNAVEPNDLDSCESVSVKLIAIEEAHQKADELMCTVLSDLSCSRGVEIFRKMAKYYI